MTNLVDHIEFEVIREPWNIYEIEKKGILRSRMIISRIATIDQNPSGNVNAAFKSTNSVDIIPFKEILGKPSNARYSPDELNNSIVEKDISFKIKNEDWNAYKLTNGKELRIKHTELKIKFLIP